MTATSSVAGIVIDSLAALPARYAELAGIIFEIEMKLQYCDYVTRSVQVCFSEMYMEIPAHKDCANY